MRRVRRRDRRTSSGFEGIMNGYNFTERVRKVLAMAREEAARLHHEYVGTEHILLGLIREGEGVAAAVLQNLSVDLDEIQQKIEETVLVGKAAQATGPDLPYTSRAKKVLELAMSEARELNHSYVGTEHLLLGLLREEIVRLLGPFENEHTESAPRVRRADTPAGAVREAHHQLAQTQAATAYEERMWARLRNAFELCQRLGTTPRLTRRPAGGVAVRVDDRITIVIPDLPGLEWDEGTPPAAG